MSLRDTYFAGVRRGTATLSHKRMDEVGNVLCQCTTPYFTLHRSILVSLGTYDSFGVHPRISMLRLRLKRMKNDRDSMNTIFYGFFAISQVNALRGPFALPHLSIRTTCFTPLSEILNSRAPTR